MPAKTMLAMVMDAPGTALRVARPVPGDEEVHYPIDCQ